MSSGEIPKGRGPTSSGSNGNRHDFLLPFTAPLVVCMRDTIERWNYNERNNEALPHLAVAEMSTLRLPSKALGPLHGVEPSPSSPALDASVPTASPARTAGPVVRIAVVQSEAEIGHAAANFALFTPVSNRLSEGRHGFCSFTLEYYPPGKYLGKVDHANHSEHVRGATSTPLIETTIGAAFDAATERLADHEALVVRHQNIRWTYAEFRRQVDEFAAGLVALGLQPGERVGIWSTNNAEWVVTQFATAKAGLILVNINPGYRIGELEYALNKVECACLICAAAFRTSDYVAVLNDLMPEIATSTPGQLRAARAPSLRWLICIGADVPGFVRFDKVAARAEPSHRTELAARAATQKNTDAINIQFTSGTTGSPKGATLSHRNILNNAYFVGQRMGTGEGDDVIHRKMTRDYVSGTSIVRSMRQI